MMFAINGFKKGSALLIIYVLVQYLVAPDALYDRDHTSKTMIS